MTDIAPSPRKLIGRPPGSKNKPKVRVAPRPIPKIVTADAKATNNALTKLIGDHFQTQVTVYNYLDTLAVDHVATYVSLVAKVVPQSIAVDVTHHAIDLGAAMEDATRRLRAYRAGDDVPVIDLVADGRAGAWIGDGGGGGGGPPEFAAAADDCGTAPDILKISSQKKI